MGLHRTSTHASPRAPRHNASGRPFRKYLILILLPVTVALLALGAISVDTSFQEIKSGLASSQHEEALAAAYSIEQYILQIEGRLIHAARPQLDASDVESRRIEFLKLLRQAPEVTAAIARVTLAASVASIQMVRG